MGDGLIQRTMIDIQRGIVAGAIIPLKRWEDDQTVDIAPHAALAWMPRGDEHEVD